MNWFASITASWPDMEVYRLAREPYARTLSGIGAALKGGRWNSPGTELIYSAINRSLAMAEVAVHFSLAMLPDDYRMVSIHIPDELSMEEWNEEDLPLGWKEFPHPESTRKMGDAWVLQRRSALLKVPSAVTRGDHNILINPFHQDFQQISITAVEPFPFDHRLFGVR